MISLVDAGVTIHGRHYAVQNNYQSIRHRQIYIPYKDLLAVDRIRRRSKKLFFVFILAGSIMTALVNLIMRGFAFTRYIGGEDVLVNIIVVLTIITASFMLAVAFSSRAYIELTFIGGIIRVPCSSMSKAKALRLVAEIRKHKHR
jgi:hypothetical protein